MDASPSTIYSMNPEAAIDERAFHDFEQAGWQKAAAYYSATFGTLTARAAGPLLDALGVGAGLRILDVATGPGYVAAEAAARGAAVVGVDFSPLMLGEAARRHPSLHFEAGDAEALPFDDGSFDRVAMNFGLLHLARPEAAMREARRVLVAGGRYAFTVWARPEEAVGFGVVLRAMESLGRADVGLPSGPPFFRFSDPDECRQTLERIGFADPRVRPLPLVWHLASADDLFEAALCGGVRTSAALQAQSPDALDQIRQFVQEALSAYPDAGGIALPMGAVLASAMKP
jgi:SAM-dependent methyltransferase